MIDPLIAKLEEEQGEAGFQRDSGAARDGKIHIPWERYINCRGGRGG